MAQDRSSDVTDWRADWAWSLPLINGMMLFGLRAPFCLESECHSKHRTLDLQGLQRGIAALLKVQIAVSERQIGQSCMVAKAGGDLPSQVRPAPANIGMNSPLLPRRTRPRKPPMPFHSSLDADTLPPRPKRKLLPSGPPTATPRL